MAGKKVGDRFQTIVPPDEGYGERVEDAMRPMSRDELPDDIALEPGMPFVAHGPDGEPFAIWVSRIEENTIWMDANHPLSGMTLHYDVEIVDIRDAADDEIAQGHPHTEEGQQGESRRLAGGVLKRSAPDAARSHRPRGGELRRELPAPSAGLRRRGWR
jgi:FKBP-type peptidyl-prolyl cis-trans isomerase 2